MNNEDNFWCFGSFLQARNTGTGGICKGSAPLSAFPSFAVMDGMGGESCGEEAAFLAAEEFGRFLEGHRQELPEDYQAFFRKLCDSMNGKVVRYAVENHIRAMGSTTVFLCFDRKTAYAGNLGDSRLYLLSGGELRQLSTDHVYAREKGQKGPLLQYLGAMEPDTLLDPSPVALKLRQGDKFLLCTDGVTDMLVEEELKEILLTSKEPEDCAEQLLCRALEAGGRDNITAIVCDYRKRGIFSLRR